MDTNDFMKDIIELSIKLMDEHPDKWGENAGTRFREMIKEKHPEWLKLDKEEVQ